MIYINCIHYCGDEDCNKCGVNGYIFGCEGCSDYDDYYSTRNKQEGSENGK